MPELPEAETVRRVLEPHLLKKKITGVQILNAQVIAAPLPEQFIAGVTGQEIAACARRGKFLRLLFGSGDSLTIHLRMTGCLTVEPQSAPPEKHTHVVFDLGDGSRLRYADVRRLGKLWFAKSGEEDTSGADRLGIEPFDGSLTAEYLRSKCRKSKKNGQIHAARPEHRGGHRQHLFGRNPLFRGHPPRQAMQLAFGRRI